MVTECKQSVKCDILIIGAGPAGLWAAKTAAGYNLDVVILEEHPCAGFTKHCSGWLLGCEFTYRFFNELKQILPHQKVSRFIIRDPVSGAVKEDIEDTGWGGYLVRRELFDRELARLAILAGAKLFLNAKATSLIREDNHVVGVRTSSARIPEVRARAIISADGMKSATATGFAKREIAIAYEAEIYPGVQMELVNVRDVVPGIIEIYESTDTFLAGRSLWPHGNGITLSSFSSIEAYSQIKLRQDNALSYKIALSSPIYMSSFLNRRNMGLYYQRLTKDGLIFVGEACGCSGIIHGMISGYYAALAVKDEILNGNKTIKADEQYENMMRNSDIYKNPFCYRNIRNYYGLYKNWLERSKEIRASVP
ncbi:MAG: NAD(P)/FAD-dependent oxidoreductase [Proteobacteria bacterium]|nr:NAD(P)/FAD-dependent oxidoreductase [Pseudomonadota bacterium]